MSCKLLLLLVFFARPAMAIDMSIPLACIYGEDCFIENYFDHEPKPDIYLDHTCGKLSSDGNVTTDFKLRDHVQMKDGINVLAVDSGVIKSVRDGMSDISVDLIGEEAVRGRECGNGIVITHKRGYETQYCHLKRNSILVKQGEAVEKGQEIAQVGLSGITSFPYLEFSVRLNGKPIDPFTGENPVTEDSSIACDSLDIYPLWDKQTEKKLKYISTAMLGIGFSKKVPHARGAREGKFGKTKIDHDARLLVLWTDIFGVVKGDELKMSIIDPDGKVIKSEVRTFSANRRHMFQFLGKKPESEFWMKGEYIGKIELSRIESGAKSIIVNESTVVQIVNEEKSKKASENKT